MIAGRMADAAITPLPPARMSSAWARRAHTTPTTPDGGLPVDPTLE